MSTKKTSKKQERKQLMIRVICGFLAVLMIASAAFAISGGVIVETHDHTIEEHDHEH